MLQISFYHFPCPAFAHRRIGHLLLPNTSMRCLFSPHLFRGTNGQSPNQIGGAATPGDTQSDKALAGLRCPECGVKFESLEDLESHVQTDHPEVSPETSAAGKKAEASPAPKVRRGRREKKYADRSVVSFR